MAVNQDDRNKLAVCIVTGGSKDDGVNLIRANKRGEEFIVSRPPDNILVEKGALILVDFSGEKPQLLRNVESIAEGMAYISQMTGQISRSDDNDDEVIKRPAIPFKQRRTRS